MAFGVIGHEMETASQMQLQRELGNVEADIQDVDIVLTHTCRIRATMICGCRAQATVRVWDNGRKWNELYDASRSSVCEGSTFSPAPSSARLQPGGGLQLGLLFQVCQAGQSGRYKGSVLVSQKPIIPSLCGVNFQRHAQTDIVGSRADEQFVIARFHDVAAAQRTVPANLAFRVDLKFKIRLSASISPAARAA